MSVVSLMLMNNCNLQVRDVLYHPTLANNLLSVSPLPDSWSNSQSILVNLSTPMTTS